MSMSHIVKSKQSPDPEHIFTISANLEELCKYFHSLIRALYDTTELFYVEHDGKFYYNCTNICSSYDTSELPEHVRQSHEDFVCDSDDFDECPYESSKTKIVRGTESYIFRHDPDKVKSLRLINFTPEMKKIFGLLETVDMKKIIFLSPYHIKLVNNAGPNTDHRGSDHAPIVLPFYSEITLGDSFTLHDFAVAAYSIKSHKFDFNYELFCGIEQVIYDFKNLELSIMTCFDHGS